MAVKIRDSLVTLLGGVLGQISLFLVIFLLGKESGPEVVGEFNYFVSLSTFLGTVVVFRYELACLSNSYADSLNSSAHVGALLVLVVFALALGAALIFPSLNFNVWIYVFGYALSQILLNVLNTQRKYGLMAVLRAAPNLIFLFAIVLEFLQGAALAVADGGIYSWIVLAVPFLFFLRLLPDLAQELRGKGISLYFFRNQKNFPFYVLPGTLFGSVATYFLSVAIPIGYGVEAAGYFAIAYRLGAFPVGLVGQSVGNVIRRDCMEAIHGGKESVHSVLKKYAYALLALALTYMVLGNFFAKLLLPRFFGEEWRGAVDFFFRLSPMFAIQLVYVPLSQVLLVLRKQRLDFFMQLSIGGGLLSAWSVAHVLDFSVLEAVAFFCTVGASIYLIGLFVLVRMIRSFEEEGVR